MARGWQIFAMVALAVFSIWNLLGYLSLEGMVSMDRFQDSATREIGFMDLALVLIMIYLVFGKAVSKQARLVSAAIALPFAVGLVLRMTRFEVSASYYLIRSR